MIKSTGSLNSYIQAQAPSFKQGEEKDKILAFEKDNSPLATKLRIGADKFQNALTVYPVKGLSGNRNANFYEFLTMGMVPYAVGSLTMMSVFNGATKFFNPNAAAHASKLGKRMALGVVLYGAFKNLSKTLIEAPIKAKYGVDLNMPYKKVIHELPESANDKDLISYEYHKVFESSEFPRFDLLYDAKYYGDKRNSYYDYVASKMGMGKDVKDSDQVVKPKIKDLIIKSRTFTTISSYLWAAVGVGIAMQTPWDSLLARSKDTGAKPALITKLIERFPKQVEAINKFADEHINSKIVKNAKLSKIFSEVRIEPKYKAIRRSPAMLINTFMTSFKRSVKDFYQGGAGHKKSAGIAAKALLFSAIGATLVGNIVTLVDFNKLKQKKAAAAPLIDDSKAKVVC